MVKSICRCPQSKPRGLTGKCSFCGGALPVEDKRIQAALEAANEWGSIDGGHHKMWVIDQMVRLLCGDEDSYRQWVANHKRGEDGPDTYDWDEGIAP